MPPSFLRQGSWRPVPTFLAIAGLIALGIGGLAACGGASQQDIVNDAAGCGHFVFPSSRSIVLATTDADWHGDGRIKLVADIPTSDLDSFEKLSGLPSPRPDSREEWENWVKTKSKTKELADVLQSGKFEDFRQVYQGPRESPSGRERSAVIQRLDGGKSRVYISISCF